MSLPDQPARPLTDVSSSLRNDRSLPMSLEFIRVRSYVNDHSTDAIEIIGITDLSALTNKHLLIIEDIIDTGVTMVALKTELEKYKPKTVHVVSLFTKRRKDKKCIFKPDYSGFEVPDHFIVGYALVSELGRLVRQRSFRSTCRTTTNTFAIWSTSA